MAFLFRFMICCQSRSMKHWEVKLVDLLILRLSSSWETSNQYYYKNERTNIDYTGSVLAAFLVFVLTFYLLCTNLIHLILRISAWLYGMNLYSYERHVTVLAISLSIFWRNQMKTAIRDNYQPYHVKFQSLFCEILMLFRTRTINWISVSQQSQWVKTTNDFCKQKTTSIQYKNRWETIRSWWFARKDHRKRCWCKKCRVCNIYSPTNTS